MRWSIRSQILVPLFVVQSVALASMTVATATLAARQGERQLEERLAGVLGVLAETNFPRTNAVLTRMHQLSGAHFLAFGPNDQVVGQSLDLSFQKPDSLVRIARPLNLNQQSLRELPAVRLQGNAYRIVRVENQPREEKLVVLFPETGRRRARIEAALPPSLLGLAALGVVAGWTGWTADRIARRLRRVEQGVARIAQGQSAAIDVRGPHDEVRELAASVERMGHDLRTLHEQVRQSERAGVLAQLAAGLAHQLRNAMTGARVSVQLHARRRPECAEEPALQVALRQLRLTEEQLRGLLAMGKDESPGLLANDSAISDLQALVDDVATLLAPSCEHAHVQLSCKTESVSAAARTAELRTALLNLALNAIEAAGAGGKVRMEARRDDDRAVIEVFDTGPGPPPGLADRLFEPFVTSKPEGVGLGLAMASRVASQSGGALSWSRRHAQTCFRLVLPAAPKIQHEDGNGTNPDRR